MFERRVRAALETPRPDSLPLRQGRVIRWLEDALSPLRKTMKPAAVRRLAISIRAAFGIEPFVWLVDIAGLSRKAAIDTMRNTVETLLRAALSSRASRT